MHNDKGLELSLHQQHLNGLRPNNSAGDSYSHFNEVVEKMSFICRLVNNL